jgi:ABC-type glycerol-3-phosphate transport system permease component
MTGYKNALIYTTLGTVLSLVVTIMTAYPLSRKDLWGRNAVTAFFTFTMLFGGGLIPTYLLINDLRLINTLWVMVLPMGVSVWNMVIMRTYFTSNIPDELYEAASMDGCRDLSYLFRVVLPLSGPIIAVICLYVAVGAWNGYFHALIYLRDKDKYPLQVFLRDILVVSGSTDLFDPARGENEATQAGLATVTKYAVIIIASAPMLILYPFIQKYFVKGVMIGSIKG